MGMKKEISELIQHINDGLPNELKIPQNLGTPEVLENFTAFLKNGTNSDEKLESSLQSLANTLSELEKSKHEKTYTGNLIDAQYYPEHQYIFSRIIIAMIAEYGLNEQYQLNTHAAQWLTESKLANDLIYPTHVYAPESYFVRTGWVNFWQGYLAKRRIIAAINKAINEKEEESEEENRKKLLKGICSEISQSVEIGNESDNDSNSSASDKTKDLSVDNLYDILHTLNYKENEEAKKDAVKKLLNVNKNNFDYLIKLFNKLNEKNNKDKFLTLNKFSFYQALYTLYYNPKENVTDYQRLINNIQGNAILNENINHFHNAYKKAQATTDWQSKGMLFGGAAIGGEVSVFIMEVVINLAGIENAVMIPFAGIVFLLASIGMGCFFYFSHADELFKAKLHEYYYQTAKIKLEDNRTFNQKLIKNMGTGTEGVMAATGTVVSLYFCSDLITASVTGEEMTGFLPGKFTYQQLSLPKEFEMLLWDMPTFVLAIGITLALLIPGAIIGYSIFNGHKTLDGPHCDEFIESKKAQEKLCSELPTGSTEKPLRFSQWQGMKHTWGIIEPRQAERGLAPVAAR